MLSLWGIIANLLTIPGYYDVALRDFGLSIGALGLGRLARARELERHGTVERTANAEQHRTTDD